MSRIPRFTAEPPANSTGRGQFHIDLAQLLHDEAFGASWWQTGRTTIFPVGSRGVSVHPTGAVLPTVGQPITMAAPPSIPPAIDRRDIPQNQEELPTLTWNNVGGRWQITHPSVNGGVPLGGLTEAGMRSLSAELGIPTARGSVAHLQHSTNDLGGAMDLGDFFSDIYGGIDAAVGGVLPGGVPFGSVTPTGGVPAVAQYLAQPDGTAVPAVQTGAPMAQTSCNHGPSPVYKKVCGEYKWVYPKRRRRRRLLTQSDAVDLAKLKGILGQGKAMELWIATHSK